MIPLFQSRFIMRITSLNQKSEARRLRELENATVGGCWSRFTLIVPIIQPRRCALGSSVPPSMTETTFATYRSLACWGVGHITQFKLDEH